MMALSRPEAAVATTTSLTLTPLRLGAAADTITSLTPTLLRLEAAVAIITSLMATPSRLGDVVATIMSLMMSLRKRSPQSPTHFRLFNDCKSTTHPHFTSFSTLLGITDYWLTLSHLWERCRGSRRRGCAGCKMSNLRILFICNRKASFDTCKSRDLTMGINCSKNKGPTTIQSLPAV